MMLETRAKNKLWLAGAVVLIPDPMALNAVPAATIVVLSHRFGFRPKQLPGGERQLVAIARALANDPPLILADEPTANLGSAIGRQVARLLRRLATQDRRAVVIVSHDSRLEEIADRVLWLRTAPSASWRPWPPTRSAAWPSLARPPSPAGRRHPLVVLLRRLPRRVRRRPWPLRTQPRACQARSQGRSRPAETPRAPARTTKSSQVYSRGVRHKEKG